MFKLPMKAITVEDGDFPYPCYVSEKYDGWRCLIADGVMYTASGKPFKPNVQKRFKPIIVAADLHGIILDGELYFEGDQFGDIASVLSASQEVMAKRNLRFYCFDVITKDNEPFEERRKWINCYPLTTLFVPVEQEWCESKSEAVALYTAVKERGGEGIMLRTPQGLYESGVRSQDIAKWKVWRTAEAKVVSIAQQACPVKYADEIIGGKGYKTVCGSVTVEILPDQPLQAYALQKATFTGSQSVALRRKFWQERESMIGKIVEFEYLKGGNVGRMARIFRVREDLTH